MTEYTFSRDSRKSAVLFFCLKVVAEKPSVAQSIAAALGGDIPKRDKALPADIPPCIGYCIRKIKGEKQPER